MGFFSFLVPKSISKGAEDWNKTKPRNQRNDASISGHAKDKKNGKDGKRNKRTASRRKIQKSRSIPTITTPSETSHHDNNVQEAFKTTNEEIITDFMACFNRRASAEEMLAFFASPHSLIKFDDTKAMPAVALVAETQKCCHGFEDLQFTYESIKEVQPGEVLVEELVVTGTHSNEFSFANFPAIPRTNKHVVMDPERCWFTVNKDGKIEEEVIIALGNLTGPPGLYLAVGGKLDMPPPPPPTPPRPSSAET